MNTWSCVSLPSSSLSLLSGIQISKSIFLASNLTVFLKSACHSRPHQRHGECLHLSRINSNNTFFRWDDVICSFKITFNWNTSLVKRRNLIFPPSETCLITWCKVIIYWIFSCYLCYLRWHKTETYVILSPELLRGFFINRWYLGGYVSIRRLMDSRWEIKSPYW